MGVTKRIFGGSNGYLLQKEDFLKWLQSILYSQVIFQLINPKNLLSNLLQNSSLTTFWFLFQSFEDS